MSYFPTVNGMASYGAGGFPQYPMAPNPRTAHPSRHFYILQVPSEHVGMVIGRGGSTIKSLQSETGGHARFFKSENEKPPYFKITGESTSVVKLAVRITEIVCEAKARAARPQSHDTSVAKKGGKKLKKIKRAKPTPINCGVCGDDYHKGTSCAANSGFTGVSEGYTPHSPTYSPHSPTYTPHSPDYAPPPPHSPHTPPPPQSPHTPE